MDSLQTFLFIVQIILSVLIILFVLLQQTEQDSLSGIGGGGANAKMLSKRTTTTPIAKTTMILFVLFMLNSLFLATISARNFTNKDSSLIENFTKEKTNSQINQTNTESNKDLLKK